MPLDDPAWLPFRQVKAAFLAALFDRHQQLLSTRAPAALPSSQHRAVRTEADALISSLEELDDELNDVQREIQQVRNSLFQRKAATIISLQPIAMLPPEIIRKIVVHTIQGPRTYRQIMRLSQVSKLWRDVVLDISALFTEAHWRKWPLALVELWCSRAGPRSLKLYADDRLLRRMSGAHGRPCRELLRKRAVQVGNLELSCHGVWNTDASDLLDLRMPSLQYLTLIIFDPETSPGSVSIRFENMPMLRVLRLEMATPEIPAPLTNVTHLDYVNYSHALQRDMVQIFSGLPQLQHLSLYLLVGPDIQTSTGPHNVLQSLISLELRWSLPPKYTSLPPLLPLDLSSLPNLQTIVLHDDRGYTSLFQSLVLQVPHLRTFYFITHGGHGEWLWLLRVLTQSTTAMFPYLHDAVFSHTGRSRLECTDEHYKLLRDFVLARKGVLTHLSIPPVENMDVLRPLKDHIAHFEVSEYVRSPIFLN